MCSFCGVGTAIVEVLFLLVVSILSLGWMLLTSIIDWGLSKITKQSS